MTPVHCRCCSSSCAYYGLPRRALLLLALESAELSRPVHACSHEPPQEWTLTCISVSSLSLSNGCFCCKQIHTLASIKHPSTTSLSLSLDAHTTATTHTRTHIR
ncbi:hypothetical protein CC79DRAFT_981464 [Sarocladium strictum]